MLGKQKQKEMEKRKSPSKNWLGLKCEAEETKRFPLKHQVIISGPEAPPERNKLGNGGVCIQEPLPYWVKSYISVFIQ